jgi:hypothetical protein
MVVLDRRAELRRASCQSFAISTPAVVLVTARDGDE